MRSKLQLVTIFLVLSSFNSNIFNEILDKFSDQPLKDQFKVWHGLYQKSYSLESDEASRRYKIWKQNKKSNEEKNALNNGMTWGLNQFSDLTQEEFEKNYLNPNIMDYIKKFKNTKDTTVRNLFLDEDDDDTIKRPTVITTPSVEALRPNQSINWAKLNWTTCFGAVRDQKSCGSCWAFASTAALEGARCVQKNVAKPVPYLSPQQLVNCDTNDNGCNGGFPAYAYDYLMTTTGSCLESAFTYTATEGSCKTCTAATGVIGYHFLQNATSAHAYLTLQKGPFAGVIDGSAFGSYKTGIFTGVCKTINHAITVIGYGNNGTTGFWIVRNSWGTTWGEKGNVRIGDNDANFNCFVTLFVVQPRVSK